MKKFTLFFILSLLLIAFGAFFINTYQLQKKYFQGKTAPEENKESQDIVNKDIPSSFTIYSKQQYDSALEEKRIIVLFFTSNWCKECLDQESVILKVFNEFNKEGVVGLTVHILDSETTTETDALAKKFDVTKESSFIILDKKGSVAYKYVGSIEETVLKQKIEEVILKDDN